jgi:hypothetical protein
MYYRYIMFKSQIILFLGFLNFFSAIETVLIKQAQDS